MKKFTIALAGNPNCGKTSLFNALTGSKQTVGNWPGVTVEQKKGFYSYNNKEIEIVDLPGIYSFSAYSLDEKVSREYILKDKPDLVIDIIDASNMERNLYLTAQLLEMKIPLIVVLNMMDIVKQRKIKIEIDHLAKHLDASVIPIVANKKEGIEQLKDGIDKNLTIKHIPKTNIMYDSVVENYINRLTEKVKLFAEKHNVNERWLAIKLLESDELAINMTENSLSHDVENFSKKIEKHIGDPIDIVTADGRYGFIHGLIKDVVKRSNEFRKTLTESIDNILLNRIIGIPFFLGIMYLIFLLTINVGTPFIGFFDKFFGTIFVDGFRHILELLHSPQWLITLFADGIGGGLQTVSTFIPPIFFMFLSLSFLEDSGYMSRAAFVMDKFMKLIGLPGKAFIPMLVGFGCNVPAILATRTLENNRDRILTILINPFMSCGARLPVYALFASIFFPKNGGIIIFSLYMIGITIAILSGLLFKKTILKGEPSTFVMELPTYHIPTINGIMMHTWQKLKSFIWKAGKIIVMIVIILNFLNSIGSDGSFGNNDSSNSILSRIGKAVTPVFTPMGITKSNWPATVGIFTGVFAKESVIGTLNSIYGSLDKNIKKSTEKEKFNFWQNIEDSFKQIEIGFTKKKDKQVNTQENDTINEHGKMQHLFKGKNNAFAFLLFILLYSPCLATIAAIYNETNWKWTLFSVSYQTTLAWIIASLFFQLTQIYSHPVESLVWVVGLVLTLILVISILKLISKKNWGKA